jgi:hypothetical protein
VLTLEQADGVRWSTCEHCGKTTKIVHGFVYQDEMPFAVYHAALADGHDHAELRISIGDWGDESDAASRERVIVSVRKTPNAYEMAFVDPHEDGASELGRMLSRAEALASPRRERYFEVCDLVLDADARVRTALA